MRRMAGKSDCEAASVQSAAQRHTHFLDSPLMAAVISRSHRRQSVRDGRSVHYGLHSLHA